MESELDMVIWLNNHEATERDKREALEKARMDRPKYIHTGDLAWIAYADHLEARLKEAEERIKRVRKATDKEKFPCRLCLTMKADIEEALKGLGKEKTNDQN